MYGTNRSINHPVEFDNAIYFAHHVAVWMQGEMIDSGYIQDHDTITVKIGGNYFMKQNCEFKVK